MATQKPAGGGITIRHLVRKPPLAPAAAAAAAVENGVSRLSLDAKKAPPPPKGPSELYAEVLEAAHGDVGAAAARVKELLAAGSRAAAAVGGLALREGPAALHQHGALAAGVAAGGNVVFQAHASAGLHAVCRDAQQAHAAVARSARAAGWPHLCRRLPVAAPPLAPRADPSISSRAGLLAAVEKAIGEDSLPLEREAGLTAYAALAREGSRPLEPFLLPLLPAVLACHADKVRGGVELRWETCAQKQGGAGHERATHVDVATRWCWRRCSASPAQPQRPSAPCSLGETEHDVQDDKARTRLHAQDCVHRSPHSFIL